jgi:Transposase DDE domain
VSGWQAASVAKKKKQIRSRDIGGLKYFHQLVPLLEQLHDVGTERDKAGNRELFMDQYCMLVLLFLFNPIVDSLRGIQQASELEKVQKKLGCSRASLGSLSEATDVFDPERLRKIVEELGGRISCSSASPSQLKEIRHLLTAVDGTVIKTLSRLAEAAYLKSPSTGKPIHAWRLHMQYEVERHQPSLLDVTGAMNQGEQDERAVLQMNLQPGRCYIMDRGYAKFALYNAIHRQGSNYVCRIRDNSAYQAKEERPLDEAARAAGVVRDTVALLGQDRKGEDKPQHAIRVVVIQISPHTNRGNHRGHESDGFLRIATDMLDVPADLIALIYKFRWTVEIFFRFLKQILGCRRLISTDPVGIEIQTYCAIIACLLIALYTGRKPTKRTYEMICFYFMGWATENDLRAHLEKLKPQV